MEIFLSCPKKTIFFKKKNKTNKRKTKMDQMSVKEKLALEKVIFKKFDKLKGSCVRFIDGNNSNQTAENMRWVFIVDALKHLDDWSTDLEWELTEKELNYIKSIRRPKQEDKK